MNNPWSFTRTQVQWIAENYIELQSGIWPDVDHAECQSKVSIQARASYENPCMLAAEFAARVKMCGQDGMLVSYRYGMQKPILYTEKDVAEAWHLLFETVCSRISRVLWYCTSERGSNGTRRTESYHDWERRTRR